MVAIPRQLEKLSRHMCTDRNIVTADFALDRNAASMLKKMESFFSFSVVYI